MELEEKLATYIKKMNDLPLLTFDREKEISTLIQARLAFHKSIKDEKKRKESEKEDKILSKAIDEIVTYNLRLVVKEAFKFNKSTGVNVRDLIGAGNLGLVKAAYLYDYKGHNNRFSTYATYWIRNAIFETVHSSGLVTIPTHILNGRYRHNKITENGDITDAEAMEKMDLNEVQFKKIKDANFSVISMDQVASNGDGEDLTTFGDRLADDKAIDPFEEAANQGQYDSLYEALGELDEESRDIISSQLLQDDKAKLKELAEKYGKTGERIRQIREKALKTLRKKIEYKRKFNSGSKGI